MQILSKWQSNDRARAETNIWLKIEKKLMEYLSMLCRQTVVSTRSINFLTSKYFTHNPTLPYFLHNLTLLNFLYVAVYVDDLNILAYLNSANILKKLLAQHFDMKLLSKIFFCLGLQINHMPDGSILLHQ